MTKNYSQEHVDDLIEIDFIGEGESDSLPSIMLKLDGVSTEEELEFIRNKSCKEGANVIPFYITFGLENVYVCDVDLTIDLLLNLKCIGLNHYTLVLKNGDKSVELLRPNIDEGSIEMLLNFVRIGGLD